MKHRLLEKEGLKKALGPRIVFRSKTIWRSAMLMTNEAITGELQTEFLNKNGHSVTVYVNLLMEERIEGHYSRLYFKIRTNRFVETEQNTWMRIIDFKNKKNEFYVTIDSPFNKSEFKSPDDVENAGWTVSKLKSVFGVDIENVWKTMVDKHCTWELEEVAL